MSLTRTRKFGAAAALFSGALLLVGCGQATGSAPEGVSNAAIQQGGSTEDISASPCSAEDFKVDLNPQPGRPGVFLLAATNTSDKACPVSGWATLTPENMAGEPLEVPTENVEIPGGFEEISLEPGRTAFAGVHLELGDKNEVPAATGFKASFQDTSGQVNADIVSGDQEYFEYAIESMQIGTFQPSPQGVTF
ncbi:DUF4232 domain-containing protein [Saccharopolyspora gloriosae]|uniref:DUF4232 domain-containing protein n=1 Tax=Saccharopolyspora gloriosae TaxID=455344 RepID=UPI001FB69ADB|nr:DUF4232 domain-containing protein [Saccharopolyspora gloriosae]